MNMTAKQKTSLISSKSNSPWTTTETKHFIVAPCMTHLNLILSISHSPLHVAQSSCQDRTPSPRRCIDKHGQLLWSGMAFGDNDGKKTETSSGWLLCGTVTWQKEPNLSLMQMLYNFLKRYIWMRTKDTFFSKDTMDPSSKTPSFRTLRLTRPLVVQISSAEDVVSDREWKEGLRVKSR